MGRQELIEAIKAGNTSKVSEILQNTGLNNEPILKGHLVIIAIEEDQADVVRILCESGLSLDVVRSDDLMPIHVAAKYGNVEIVETLLRAGAGVNDATAMHRMTPLTMAIRWKQEDALLHLLDAGANPNISSAHFKELTTPLHEASKIGHKTIVNLLLATGADVNASNGLHELPLHIVAGTKTGCQGPERRHVVKRLIDCGSRVNTTDLNGNMPLHLALYTAIDDEDVQTIHLLCVAGASVNGYNGRGLTPLHVAVKHAVMYKSCPASLKSIQTLLGFGADINKDDTDTVLPVQMALVGNCRKHKALLDLLVGAGSNLEHLNDQGESILQCCAMSENGASGVQFLLQHKVNYNTVSLKGHSPLSSACMKGWKNTIITLVQACPGLLDPRAAIPDVSQRPLSYAAKLGDLSLVKILLEAGYRWTAEEITEISTKPDVSHQMADYLERLLQAPSVGSLANQCRLVIRMSLYDDLKNKVEGVMLPRRLQDFLLLTDLCPLFNLT